MTNVINPQWLPKQKSLCYFAPLEQGRLGYYDSDFNLLRLPMHGSFAFLRYQNPALFVLGKLNNYGSHHSAYALLVKALKQQIALYRSRFFSMNGAPFFLPVDQPTYGGGVTFLHGQVVYWHLKSRSFSLHNPACHDGSLELTTIKNTAGFPFDRYISVDMADFYETYFMRQMFQPDGEYQLFSPANTIADKICLIIQLPPLCAQNPENKLFPGTPSPGILNNF
jgi:hypothetical protein